MRRGERAGATGRESGCDGSQGDMAMWRWAVGVESW